MRPKGAKNVISFEKRISIATSSGIEVRHLANITGTPLEEFSGLLKHQENFLNWLDKRHESIVSFKKEIHELKNLNKGKGPKGAKEATFVKYRWYAEHLVLLEAINAFETFYKKTFTGLGSVLQGYVQPDDERVIRINARQLWAITGETVLPSLVPALVFEQELFHDLDAVDSASDMLIGKRRYKKKDKNNPLQDRVKSLRGIFQIRHTLSHNGGFVTQGDKAKFDLLNFNITGQEVIDPAKDHLGLAILKELHTEAKDFTDWLAVETAAFLRGCIADRGLSVPAAKKQELESLLGSHACWATVSWS